MPVTAAIVAGTIAAGKGVQSLVRANRAKKEMERLGKGLKDPSFSMPAELMQAYDAAKAMPVSRNMPGYGAIQNMASMQQQGALGDISKYGTGLDAVAAMTNLGTQSMAQQQEIGIQNSQNYQSQLENRQQNMAGIANQLAGFRQYEYEQNVLNPFLRTSAAISALRRKRYQESNLAFDSFANVLQAGAGAINPASITDTGGGMAGNIAAGGGTSGGGTSGGANTGARGWSSAQNMFDEYGNVILD
jgi:hypothetical protein